LFGLPIQDLELTIEVICQQTHDSSNIVDCVLDEKQTMPKLKTRKAAAKRFRATGSGKIRRRKAFKNHMLEHKNSARRRTLSQLSLVNERDEANVRLMLPYL